ncbi:hypothetical protein V3C99_016549 [Haemonchus contortus]|uniref:ShKT domain-containing protein n=1 Tax=Haemonchus contortus TaxID=6289 RepID=A0A7I4YZV7_HAECO
MRLLFLILCILMVIVTSAQKCKDEYALCIYAKRFCKSKNYTDYMKKHCKKTCGYCRV